MRGMATQAEIDTLKEAVASLNGAIASGARSVTLRGQTITYNTTTSLIAARDDMLRQLTAALVDPTAPRRRTQGYLYQSGRGYD